jgi:hypothetical protein
LYLDIKMSASRVVIIRGRHVLGAGDDPDRSQIVEMLSLGFRRLTGARDMGEGLARLFSRNDRIGIKVNTIGGPKISTRPVLPLSLSELLVKGGRPGRNIVIWDRTNRELREAGYSLSDRRNDLKIFGTDTAGRP